MSTQGFHTRIVLAILSALGLVLTLGRSWYAPAPDTDPNGVKGIGDVNGPLYDLFHGMQRWITTTGGTTGWDALDQWALALAVTAGVAVVGALACLAPPLQSLARDVLRYGALAACAITLWKLLDPPGTNSAMELRLGALIGTGCAALLLTSALGAAAAPLRRRTPTANYEAPLPPVYGNGPTSAGR